MSTPPPQQLSPETTAESIAFFLEDTDRKHGELAAIRDHLTAKEQEAAAQVAQAQEALKAAIDQQLHYVKLQKENEEMQRNLNQQAARLEKLLGAMEKNTAEAATNGA